MKGSSCKVVIQASNPHTGSTVLVNALAGLYGQEKLPWEKPHRISCGEDEVRVVKTHTDCDDWKRLNPGAVVVESRRQRHGKITSCKPDVVVPYDELANPPLSADRVVDNVAGKMQKFLPHKAQMKSNAVRRLTEMNDYYETIKHKPMQFYDDKYGIHGHHKGRRQ